MLLRVRTDEAPDEPLLEVGQAHVAEHGRVRLRVAPDGNLDLVRGRIRVRVRVRVRVSVRVRVRGVGFGVRVGVESGLDGDLDHPQGEVGERSDHAS